LTPPLAEILTVEPHASKCFIRSPKISESLPKSLVRASEIRMSSEAVTPSADPSVSATQEATDLTALRCEVLRALMKLSDIVPVLKSTPQFRFLRFVVALIVSTLCERGSSFYVSKPKTDGVAMLNCKKVVQKLISCLDTEYLRSLCQSCLLHPAEVDVIKRVLQRFELAVVDKRDRKRITELERSLTNDYVALLKFIKRGGVVAEYYRRFLQAVFSSRLLDIYRSFIELVRVAT